MRLLQDLFVTATEGPVIVTLTDICAELGGASPPAVRTLVIEYEIPFDVVGLAYGFTEPNADRVKQLWAAHVRKEQALGLKGRPRRNKAGVTA